MATDANSKVTSFSNSNQRTVSLVYGYIRRKEEVLKLMHDIPDGIQQIILKYILFNEFRFDHDHQAICFDISENKLSVTIQKDKYGTIQFGQFLKSSDKLIYRVKFWWSHWFWFYYTRI